jgi:hypothetical protein
VEHRQPYRVWACWLALVAMAGGCSTSGPITSSSPLPETNPQGQLSEQSPEGALSEQTLPARPEGPAWTISGAPVVIVLKDEHRASEEMLYVFSAALGRPYQLLNIAHRPPGSVQGRLAELAPIDVIALGPAALAVTREVPGLTVTYAGVLQPGGMHRGVDALPPFATQLEYWLQIDPQIRRIGVIGSHKVRDRIAELEVTTNQLGMVLESREVTSDKEMLLAFRGMVPHIDGFVFLPDDDVLSPNVILQVMGHGKRNAVRTLVYSPVMFNLGANLYLQPDPVAVATELIDLLNASAGSPSGMDRRVVTSMRTRVRQASQAGAPDISTTVVLARSSGVSDD